MLLDKHKIHTQVLLKPEWLEEGITPATPGSIEGDVIQGYHGDVIQGYHGDVIQGQHQTPLEETSLQNPKLAPLDPQLHIVDRILQANRTSTLLEEQRSWAVDDTKPDWTLEEGCLLHKN